MANSVRIDKFLWAVRIYKTRSLAASECKSQKVYLNERHVKSSTTIKKGDEIRVKRNPIWRSYEVLDVLEKRVGAKLVELYIKETTSAEELERYEIMKLSQSQTSFREKGRPTKKERREIDGFFIGDEEDI